jgi:histidyl-tRNA synthetase
MDTDTASIIALVVVGLTALGLLLTYLNNSKKIDHLDHYKASTAYVTDIKKDLLKWMSELKVDKVDKTKCEECQRRNDDSHEHIITKLDETKEEVCRGFKEVKQMIKNGNK